MVSIEELRGRLPEMELTDAELSDLLKSAQNIILAYRYTDYTIPENPRFSPLWEPSQLEIAVRLAAIQGAEGQQSHSENGISRTWLEDQGIRQWLNPIGTVVGVVRR